MTLDEKIALIQSKIVDRGSATDVARDAIEMYIDIASIDDWHSQPVKRFTLEEIKKKPDFYLAAYSALKTRIYSKEHGSWWRKDASGYTNDIMDAWKITFEDAFKRTMHCDPEKGIELQIIRNIWWELDDK